MHLQASVGGFEGFARALSYGAEPTVFCVVTGRQMVIDQDKRRYFDVGDRDDLTYGQKLDEYRRLADEYFQVEAYEAFCDAALPSMRQLVVDYFGGPEFDQLLVDVVRS